MNGHRTISGIYLIRGVCCILVVLIHCTFPGMFGEIIKAVARSAVPFFFITTGYFLYRNNREQQKIKLKYNIKKIFRLTITVGFVYIILRSIISILENGGTVFNWLYSNIGKKDIIYFIVFNRCVFICVIMWYFFALLYVLGIYYFFNKFNINKKVIMILVILLLCIALIAGEWLKLPWFVIGNFLLVGFPFFSIGYLIRAYSIDSSISSKYIKYLIIFGILCSISEYFIFGDIYIYAGSIILSIGLFLNGFIIFPNENSLLVRFGKNYSTSIFVTHCGIILILDALIQDTSSCWLVMKPIVIICLSIILSFLWKYIIQNYNRL